MAKLIEDQHAVSSMAEGQAVIQAAESDLPTARWRLAITTPSVVLFLSLLASQAGILVLTPILADVAREFGVSTAVAGQLRTLSGFVAGGTALLFGRIGRSIALRDLLLVGASLLAFGSIVSAAAPSFAVVAAAQVPIGIAVALLVSAGGAAAGEWARPGRSRRVLSWTLIGPAAAWIIGMPLVGLFAETTWRAAFIVLPLAASLIVGGALALCRKEMLPAPRPLVRVADILADRSLRLWAVAELLAQSAWVGTLVYAGALFVETYATSPLLTGVILAGVAIAYIPGNFTASRIVANRSALVVLPWLVAVAVPFTVLLGLARNSVFESAVILAILAFLAGGRTLAAGAYGLDAAPDRRLAVMGVRTAANQFGYLVGAAAGGLALAIGGYPAVGVLFGALFVGATVVLVRLRADTVPATA